MIKNRIKLPDLTPKQMQLAIALGCGAFVLIAFLIWLMLWLNADTTRQNRIAQTPSVTLPLAEKKEEVPSSWQEDKPVTPPAEEAAPTEAPAEEAAAPSPEVKKEETPATATSPAPAAKQEDAASHVVVTKPEDLPPETSAALPSAAPLPPAVAPVQGGAKFARPFDQQDPRPRIALVIADMGMAATATQSGIQDLPGSVTLAFSSLAPNLEADMIKARAAGHEMVLTVPMEPENYPQNDSGPNSLLAALPDAENVTRLRHALSRSEGYVGIMPSMGEKFVALEDKMAPVLDELNKDGLLIVDGTMNSHSSIAPLARLVKIPFARADVIIDAAARGPLDVQLANLETMATQKGQVVAVIKPYPVTFEKLAAWVATLESKNLILAPVSAVTSTAVRPATPAPVATEAAETPAQ